MTINKLTYRFDKEFAERSIRFIENYCVHPDGEKAGKPFRLEEFQKELLRRAHGWKHKANNRLKHRYIWFEVPKGNGKSGLLATVAIYKACAEGVKNGEIYVCAGDREQARIVHDDCKKLIEGSKKLKDKFDVRKNEIIHIKSGSRIICISAEAYTKHGFRPYCIIFDELHVQPNSELWDTLTRGLMKIKDSQCWVITTAGYAGTFYEQMHNHAEAILNGSVKDDTWLPIIYKAKLPEDEKAAAEYIWTEEAWKAANPGLGTIIDSFDFEQLALSAKVIPTAKEAFMRLHLNLITNAAIAWDILDHWRKCNKGEIIKENLKGVRCWGGLDLASTRDLSSFGLRFETGDILSWHFCPEVTVAGKVKTEHVNYKVWVENGWITSTPGNVQDYDYIEQTITEAAENYDIIDVSYDKYNSSQLIINLEEKGIKMEPHRQGFLSMSVPTKEFEKSVMSQKINHGGNPVLTWQIGNVVLDEDPAGNVKPTKSKSKEKIDGIVALIMAESGYLSTMAEESGGIDENYQFVIA